MLFISPLYQIRLQEELKLALYDVLGNNIEIERYLKKWSKAERTSSNQFYLSYGDYDELDVAATLNSMDGELLLKIAVDIGVDTPDYIPSVAVFKNEIKTSYEAAHKTFEKALKEVYEHPDLAIGLVSSTLESIIKEISKDDRLNELHNTKGTLYDLTQNLLKSLQLFPQKEMPNEIRNIGSGLLNVMKSIEDLRSTKTKLHGLSTGDYMVADIHLAQFVVNAASTVGTFLISYYKTMFPPASQNADTLIDDLPF